METVMNHHGQLQCSISQPWSPFAHCKHALVRQGIHTPRRAGSHRVFRLHATVFVRNNLKAAEKEDELEPETEGSSKKLIKFLGTRQSTPKDSKVVFVAGATGKVGSRTVRELLKFGFQVRASARNVEKAETLFQDVLENITTETEPEETNPISRFWPAKLFAFLKPKPVTPQLDIVECDLEDVESIAPALGNAGVVVCCIGASEKEIFDITGPYRIDYKATENLINAASAAEVNHFVLLTSLGTQKFGFPAAVLNLFWGVLLWKAKAEKALIESGLPYTIVRPGGMERPTDSYKETHNLALAEADKLFGGQVSNLQVAELIASIVKNPDISKDKIVEVVAETTAPLRPIRELLEEIPASGTPTAPIPQRENPRPIISVNQKEESKVLNNASEDEKLELKALKKRYEEEMEAAKEIENEARAALAEKAELEARAAEVRAKAEAAALAASRAKALEAAILAAARKGNVLSSEEKQRIMESVKTQKSEDLKDESKGIFSFFKLPTLGTETVSDDNGSIGSQPPVVEPREEAEEPVVAKIVEKKEESKKEQGAQKLAQLEAEIALKGRKKEEQERAEKEARDLEEKEAKRVEEEERKAANKKKEAEEAVVAEAVAAAEKEKEKAKQPKQQSNAVLSPYAG